MSPEELAVYSEGLSAGGRYFNSGIDSGCWVVPSNSYEGKEGEAFNEGFWTAVDDLNGAYYA